ncbi:hypothetical protein DV738_g3373, partial [Chaetothyriales sp. CBS 135597]
MQCYSELLPPSGITQALVLPFTSANANNLVIGRTSLLQIFGQKKAGPGQEGNKLVLIAQYPLSGTITSLGRVAIAESKSGGEAILIAFRDAKLTLVEWDPAEHSISSISIHYYENYMSAPWLTDLQHCVSRLTIDPNSRCAAFNFGITNLAIIPFHDSEADSAPTQRHANGNTDHHDTPFAPSFVQPITALDPGLLHPVDMAFLYEYRDPTIGILYSTAASCNNLSYERKDVMIFSVYALDIDQKASTALQTVQHLPNDLHQVIALPLPVGGSLLVGGNEVIHIDQSAKPTAIAVNEFARESSAFPMADHASLGLKLEGCRVEELGSATGDMLFILQTGELAVLAFRLDGRSVSGMTLTKLESDGQETIIRGRSSCTASLGQGRVFIGSEETDSVLISTGKKPAQPKRLASKQRRSHVSVSDPSPVTASSIRLLDLLPCVAPLNDACFGKSLKRKREDEGEISIEADPNRLDLAVACGRGRAGAVAFMSPNLALHTEKTIGEGNASGVWCFVLNADESQGYAIVAQPAEDGSVLSSLWKYQDGDLERMDGTEFVASSSKTIAVGTLSASNHTVHVTETQVRVYDAKFGLSQIFPIVDEEEGQTAKAIRADFLEPYLVLVKDDLSLSLLKADRRGEFDELDVPDELSVNITSACLYQDSQEFFQTSRLVQPGHPDTGRLLLILNADGLLTLLPLANPKAQVFCIEGLQFLPPQLRTEASSIPKHWRSKDDISDVVLADLGDSVLHTPHLIVRNISGDLAVYEPYTVPDTVGTFRFSKVASRDAVYSEAYLADQENDKSRVLPSIQKLSDVSGYSSVFVPGGSARLIIKSASTPVHIYSLDSNIKTVSSFEPSPSQFDLVFVDDTGTVCVGRIPSSTILGLSEWTVNRVELNEDVSSITYFEPAACYILGTSTQTPFQLPQDDEWHQEWAAEKTTFLPTTLQSSLRLMSSRTQNIISSHHFGPDERILCVKTMPLETSETSHDIRPLIVVGTAITRGENVVTRGNIYLFDVVSVVPHPNIPESDLRLKLITREDVRGAVTSITSIGSQGFLLAAQGQKCMVRGLREDMSILPVAFMDMRYYTHVTKELPGTGLTILGDAYSGLWLMGYSEEPYKMTLLGRDLDNPDVLAGDFLPTSGKELFIVTSDADGQLRVLQYDPENPKSDQGRKLLLRSTFRTGDAPTTITLLPRTPTASPPPPQSQVQQQQKQEHQLLITTQSGALAVLTSLSEFSYRRLSTLQNILTTQLSHACSLNPRAYRQVETDGMGGRGVIDGEIVKRWVGLSSQQKVTLADKVGARGVWEVRADLELVRGGWAYLAPPQSMADDSSAARRRHAEPQRRPSANGHAAAAKGPSSTEQRLPPSTVTAGDVLSIYVPTLFLIFFGCCSNVYTLESLISTDPSLGPLLTAVQFVFVSLFSSTSCLYVSGTAPFVHVKARQVPIRKWLVYTLLFMTVNLLNNSAFGYKISVPLHIILRSAGPVASMAVAYLFNKARYPRVKIVAVAFLFVGVQAPGFLIILLALVLSAFLGLYTDKLYSQHGRSPQATAESLFYSHTLSLPLFALRLPTLSNNLRLLATSSPPLTNLAVVHHTLSPLAPTSTIHQLLSSIPTAALMLVLNALTQCICISGVNRLAAKSSSLTVSIVLNIRKLVSLLLSIWLFGNRLPAGVVVGAAMVFLGGGLYAWPTAKKAERQQNSSAGKKEL